MSRRETPPQGGWLCTRLHSGKEHGTVGGHTLSSHGMLRGNNHDQGMRYDHMACSGGTIMIRGCDMITWHAQGEQS